MATYTAQVQVDMSTDGVFYNVTPSQVIVSNSSEIRLYAPGGYIQSYQGRFSYYSNGDLYWGGSVLTGVTEFNSAGVELARVSEINISGSTYASYANSNNFSGLVSYAFSGADAVYGSAFNDVLLGFAGNDVIHGNSGNDALVGGAGNDVLHGDAGIDYAFYSGTRTQYTVNNSNGVVYVADSVSGRDGSDSLLTVERISFSNGTLAVDTAAGQNAGEVYRLYQAAFARTPDITGVKHHLWDMETNGLALRDVAGHFLASSEFSAKYGSNPTDTEFINALYHNVLNRNASAAEVSWYQNQFNTHQMDHQAALIGFSESPENVALVGKVISNGIWLG